MPVTTPSGPRVRDDAVEFELHDPKLTGVALLHELRRPRRVEFEHDGPTFRLVYPRPEADRFEYLLELERRRGTEIVPDPTNPRRAPGPFGDKSAIEFPDYAPPEWVADEDAAAGELRELPLASVRLRTTLPALLWSAADTDPAQPLPLLVVHDGPEYAEYSMLVRLLDHLVDFGEVPEFRAVLLPPGPERDELYSASARYANALAAELLPRVREQAPYEKPPVALGASLGALAALHAHFRNPALFGGLFLQSGSFFRRRFDAHESRFGRFGRIARFVGMVHGRSGFAPPIPTAITCGTAEENAENNATLAAALERRGWPVGTHWVRDAHNWTAWRDSLQPLFSELLLRAWT